MLQKSDTGLFLHFYNILCYFVVPGVPKVLGLHYNFFIKNVQFICITSQMIVSKTVLLIIEKETLLSTNASSFYSLKKLLTDLMFGFH